MPTNFIIFRDGVGDAQRDAVIKIEISQFKEAIKELYSDQDLQSQKPEITLIVLNKRINQRFFLRDAAGNLKNPPSGCIIDRGLVEHGGSSTESDSDGEMAFKPYDFFLTPSTANEGCVSATHCFVPLNESQLKKIDIQQLTYALCHCYFNWSGPIRVPAPCQYAHKIAEYNMTIGNG